MGTVIRTTLYPKFFDANEASAMYTYLKEGVAWEQGIPSRKGPTRLAKSMGFGDDENVDVMVERALKGVKLPNNVVHLGMYINNYRNGNDWTPNHAHQGGVQVVISLGPAARTLWVGKKAYTMGNGDVIVFGSSIHGIPKEPLITEGRISIATFGKVLGEDQLKQMLGKAGIALPVQAAQTKVIDAIPLLPLPPPGALRELPALPLPGSSSVPLKVPIERLPSLPPTSDGILPLPPMAAKPAAAPASGAPVSAKPVVAPAFRQLPPAGVGMPLPLGLPAGVLPLPLDTPTLPAAPKPRLVVQKSQPEERSLQPVPVIPYLPPVSARDRAVAAALARQGSIAPAQAT
ncbi:Hypothetical protein POVN_LOCUS728 [uncultured virus]|nr:Hypothetical protein POVN_LOCUS728 [uncultured virus]